MNYKNPLIYLFSILAINTSMAFAVKNEDPCRNKEFADRITKLSPEEKIEWEKILKRSARSNEQHACQAALLGRLYESQNRFSEASSSFTTAAEKSPSLSDYFRLAKAKVEFKAENYQHARSLAQVLKSSPTSTYIKTQAEQLLARIAVIEHNNEEIIETHTNLMRSKQENEEHLFALATSLSALGHNEEAREIYKQLLIRFPSSSQADKIEHLHHKKPINLTLKEHETRFNKLIAKLEFDRAVKDADAAIKRSDKKSR